MRFEWDPAKSARNREERGIDFLGASAVFEDPHRIELPDERRDYGETRIKVIGMIADRIVLAVVYTDRGGINRVISARRTNRRVRQIDDQGKTAI
ncbi:MAG: BrnT family toxin [Thermomicrobiales bacterium]